jgi:hypothetical protein
MAPQEVVDFIAENGQKFKFGVWEATDEQLSLETEMVSKTNLLELLEERQDDTLRLVPVIAGG